MRTVYLAKYPFNGIREDGVILSQSGFPMKNGHNHGGYCKIDVKLANGSYKTVYVHRLVAEAFIGMDPSDKSVEVDHDDDDKDNNRYTNLVLLTPSQNTSKAQDWRYEHDTTTHKRCRRCNEVKLRIWFTIRVASLDGLDPTCKSCQNVNRKKL